VPPQFRHPWLGVEVRHLATLIAVARTRSFRQAATELGYVQSAVSQQIAALEAVVGARLVERRRGRRTVELTPAGELLVERSHGIVGQLHAARVDVMAIGEGGDLVRLVVTSDLAPLLAQLLPDVTTALPELRLQVTEAADDADLVARLERGDGDLGIGAPPPGSALSTATLLVDPYVVLVPRDSHLAGTAAVARAQHLAGERLIVSVSGMGDPALRAAGLPLDRALQVPVATAVPALVAAGLGVGLVPRSAAGESLAVLSTATLLVDPYVVLVPRDSHLAGTAAVARAQHLAGERLIVSVSAMGDPALRAAGLPLDRALQVPVATAVPALVAAGLGVGLVPRSAAGDSLAVLSTAGLFPGRRVVLCRHRARRRTALLEAFSAAALGAVSESRRGWLALVA